MAQFKGDMDFFREVEDARQEAWERDEDFDDEDWDWFDEDEIDAKLREFGLSDDETEDVDLTDCPMCGSPRESQFIGCSTCGWDDDEDW